MKRILQLYVIAACVHVIFVVLYFATEHIPRETDDFLASGLFGWFLFPFVPVFESVVVPAVFERFAIVVLGCNTLAWAAVVSAVMLACRAFLVSDHARRTALKPIRITD